MSTALTIAGQTAILPTDNEFQKMLTLAAELAQSGILPKGIPPKPAAVLYIIQTGYELGIPPGAALRMISLVEGKPTLDAQMQRALIFRDHGDDAFIFEETNADLCTIAYKRRSWKEYRHFTLKASEMAHLKNKDNWRNYGANMLRARATTFVANMAFSDSTLGLYTPDEMTEAAGGDVAIGADGEPVIIARDITPAPQADAAPERTFSDRELLNRRLWALSIKFYGEDVGDEIADETERKRAKRTAAHEALHQWIESLYPEARNADGAPSVAALTDEQVAEMCDALDKSIAERGSSEHGATHLRAIRDERPIEGDFVDAE